jgi:hypothetical protein
VSLDGPLPNLCPVIPTAKLKIEKRGMKLKKKSSPLKLLSQSQPNFAEMILGWSPFKIESISEESFQQSLVEIGSTVSEEKIFLKFHPPFFLICIIGQNRTLWEIPIKIFLSETICSIRTKF